MRAVADAGPLHDLVLIGEIGIVPELVGEVLIPPEVRDELDRPRTPAPVRAWIVSPPAWLLVRSAPPVPVEDLALASLDTGERAAIGLASGIDADVLLMDDRAGVIAARARGLPAIGTLGLLQRGAWHGSLDLSAAFERLAATNFHVRRELLDALLTEDRERRSGS